MFPTNQMPQVNPSNPFGPPIQPQYPTFTENQGNPHNMQEQTITEETTSPAFLQQRPEPQIKPNQKKKTNQPNPPLQNNHYNTNIQYTPTVNFNNNWLQNQGHSFNSLIESKNKHAKIEAECFHIEPSESLDRVYLGTVNGEVVMMPLQNGQNQLKAKKVALKPRKVIDEDGLNTEIFEIHGLKIDAIGRVVVVNAKGFYIFDPSLSNLIWKLEENMPGISDIERLEAYAEDITRLKLDQGRRYAYWIVGKSTLNVIDLSNLQMVVQGMKLTQIKDGKITPIS